MACRTGCRPSADLRTYAQAHFKKKERRTDLAAEGGKAHAGGSSLGNGEAVVLHEGFLHRQDEVRRKALDDDSPWGWFEPPVRVEPLDPRRLCLVWLLRLEIVAGLLATLYLFCNAEILIDNGDKHLQHNDWKEKCGS